MSSSAAISGAYELVCFRDYSFANFPPGTEVTAFYTDCCRNTILTSGAAMEGVYSALSFATGTAPNSSPVIPAPQVSICAGQAASFSQAGWDADGDSLVYAFAPCYQDSIQMVTYSPGYSALAPLGPGWTCSIDPATGLVSFVPSGGGSMVSAPVGIRVDEYRNGLIIGSLTREFQVNVIACTSVNQPPMVSVQHVTGGVLTGNTLATLPGMALSFELLAIEPDLGQLPSPYPSSNYPGGVTATQMGTSTNPLLMHVGLTAPNVTQGQFMLSTEVGDNHCPLPGAAYTHLLIRIDTTLMLSQAAVTPTPCGGQQGAIDLTVVGGQLPLSFLWSNGTTTEDLTGLSSGWYTVQITDIAGKIRTDSFLVKGNLTVSVADTWVGCSPNGGQLAVSATGGIPPMTYLWSTGDTTASLSGLAAGGYQVYITDGQGCQNEAVVLLQRRDSCIVTITGNIYADMDADCVRDPADAGIPYQYIALPTGAGAFTDVQGQYTLVTDSGTHVLTVWIPTLPATPCASDTVIQVIPGYGTDSVGNDFPRLPIFAAPHDWSVSMNATPARPGFMRYTWLTVQNLSPDTTQGTLSYRYDSVFQFVQATPTPALVDTITHTATWLIPGPLAFMQSLGVWCQFLVPAAATLGAVYSDTATVITTVTDGQPANNMTTFSDSITGSFDPNDKSVSPKGETAEGYIRSSDNVLTYTIQFQNTGTDTAFYVTLRDTLDADLDLKGFKHLASSFPYTLRAEGDNILVFRFDHINLPDSGRDEAGSHGFVSFSLPMKTVAQGTVVENRAGIYFDFNAPVMTNTVRNTICEQSTAAFSATRGSDGRWVITSNMVNADEWFWNLGTLGTSTATTPEPFLLPDSGYYPLSLITKNACGSDTANLVIHEVWMVGMDTDNPLGISIHPNPAQSAASIRVASALVREVTVVDGSGRILCVLPVVNGEAMFVRGYLPAGMYYVRAVASDGRSIGMKIILE